MALNKAEKKVGDRVRLNVGGPDMAIENIFINKDKEPVANCVWFSSDGMCQRAQFLCCMLIVEPFGPRG